MANNPKIITVFDKLDETQLETLKNGGTVTKGSDTLTASTDRAYLIPSSSVSFKAQTLTDAQKAQARSNIDAAKATAIKTTMDLTAQVNTEYYLGTQSTVSVALPSTASAGDSITVDFASGSTATTLTITGSNVAGDTTYTPASNKLIELNFKYDGTYWKLLVSSIDTPSGV